MIHIPELVEPPTVTTTRILALGNDMMTALLLRHWSIHERVYNKVCEVCAGYREGIVEIPVILEDRNRF